MLCVFSRRSLGVLAVWSFVFAMLLLVPSHASAQAKPGAGDGPRKASDDPYIAIPISSLPAKMVWTIAFDHEDRPWVGTNRGGATQQEDGTWKPLTKADGLAGETVKAYLFQLDGSIWVGTDRAIDVFTAPDIGQKIAEYTWDYGLAASSSEDLEVDAAGHFAGSIVENRVEIEGTFTGPGTVEGRIVALETTGLPGCTRQAVRFSAQPKG